MMKLSVVIAAGNEERNIRNCLESVKWADEIIIVDDMSIDKTVEICKEYTKNIFINNSEGSFHKNKNLGIEKAIGDWILSIDADEIITAELKDEILTTLKSASSDIAGYYIPRKNYFLGKWIRGCGWYPDYIIRLFRKGATKWPLDIHDVPKIEEKNKAGCLDNPLIHYSYQSFNQYFEKFNRYTSRLAQEEYQKGRSLSRKTFLIYFLIKPAFSFFKKYFIQAGCRDGFHGFFISFSSGIVIFTAYAKLWEIEKNLKSNKDG